MNRRLSLWELPVGSESCRLISEGPLNPVILAARPRMTGHASTVGPVSTIGATSGNRSAFGPFATRTPDTSSVRSNRTMSAIDGRNGEMKMTQAAKSRAVRSPYALGCLFALTLALLVGTDPQEFCADVYVPADEWICVKGNSGEGGKCDPD